MKTVKTTRGTHVEYGTIRLTKDFVFCDYNDYNDGTGYDWINVPAGTEVGLRIEAMTDGRQYYTVFLRSQEVQGKVYSCTKFRSTPGGVVENGVAAPFAHREVVSGT